MADHTADDIMSLALDALASDEDYRVTDRTWNGFTVWYNGKSCRLTLVGGDGEDVFKYRGKHAGSINCDIRRAYRVKYGESMSRCSCPEPVKPEEQATMDRLNDIARRARQGNVYAYYTDEDLAAAVSAGLVSMSVAMNQDC